ncbi:MAG: VCBS repeat-containing protein [Acidobacteria bacterium]|nr:VCBS repeat-containing protein [Acidobacteriota bacterium]
MFRLSLISMLGLAWSAAAATVPKFQEHLIAGDLKGGYQVVPFDVNRDGRMDLIALASGMPDLVWFENPGWQRRTLAKGFARMINLAACPQLDEIVVAHAFENVPKRSVGIVSVLTPGANRSEPWTAREIDRLTTSHRLRCADIDGSGKPVVINAPLAGEKADAPGYRDTTPLVYYKPGEWKRIEINRANEGVVHGVYITRWHGAKKPECVMTASFSGLHAHCYENGAWTRSLVHKGNAGVGPKAGSSDVAVGHAKRTRFLAAVEPWHGEQVTIYREAKGGAWSREVIDTTLVDGHTIITVDLDGDGRDEVVAGYRGQGRSVCFYQERARKWEKSVLDNGGIAAAACAAADLNGDKRPDIACIGSATANLKWYENRGGR